MKTDLLGLLIDDSGRDPRFIGYPFVDSPKYILAISAAYLAFIFYIGPRFMRDRKPLPIKPLIRIFNTYQIIANISVVCSMSYLAFYKVNYIFDFSYFYAFIRRKTLYYYYNFAIPPKCYASPFFHFENFVSFVSVSEVAQFTIHKH